MNIQFKGVVRYGIVNAILIEPSVTQPVTISVSPAEVSLGQGQTAQFTASVGGTADQRVTWSAGEGSISSHGPLHGALVHYPVACGNSDRHQRGRFDAQGHGRGEPEDAGGRHPEPEHGNGGIRRDASNQRAGERHFGHARHMVGDPGHRFAGGPVCRAALDGAGGGGRHRAIGGRPLGFRRSADHGEPAERPPYLHRDERPGDGGSRERRDRQPGAVLGTAKRCSRLFRDELSHRAGQQRRQPGCELRHGESRGPVPCEVREHGHVLRVGARIRSGSGRRFGKRWHRRHGARFRRAALAVSQRHAGLGVVEHEDGQRRTRDG